MSLVWTANKGFVETDPEPKKSDIRTNLLASSLLNSSLLNSRMNYQSPYSTINLSGGNTTYVPQTYTPPPSPTYVDPFSTGGSASQVGPNVSESNLASASGNTRLANLVNAVNQASQQAANAGRLGPQGEQIQANSLTNIERASAGLLDPQTESMLRAGINENFGGGAVDSPALAAAYRRETGKTIEETEADAEKRYINMLAANPSAPVFDMGNLMVDPSVYASSASAEAARQASSQEAALARQQAQAQFESSSAQSQWEFEAAQAAKEQQFRDDLAYKYYMASLQNPAGASDYI